MVVESELPAGTDLRDNRETKGRHRSAGTRWSKDASFGDPHMAWRSGIEPKRSRPSRSLVASILGFVVAIAAIPGGANTTTTAAASTSSTPQTTETSQPAETTVTTQAETTTSTAQQDSSTTASTNETTTTAAGATPSTEAGNQQVEAAESAKAREVDAANVQLSELTNALKTLRADVKAQTAQVDIATRRLDAAQAIADAASEDVATLEAQVTELEFSLSDQAIRSFKGETVEEGVLNLGNDPNTGLRMQAMLAKATQSDIDYVNQLSGVREDLVARRADTDEAVALADDSRQASEDQLATLEQDRTAQGELASKAEQRLDHLLSERAALARLGATVGSDVDDKEAAALVAQLAAAPAPPPRSTSSSGIPTPVPKSEIVIAAKGIEVHESIVGDVRRLLTDAAAAGVDLAGGGYRDPAGQIAVRRNNCGTSNFAIYEMRSSRCRPPTARPGRSQHEQGKAIDFTNNCALIRGRSGGGWNWLNANANDYGLYNLPSEPWHWSVNGR